MFESVYSVSDDLDPVSGVRTVVDECRKQLGERPAHAGLFFTSCLDADYAGMLAEIHAAFPGIELVGCTTDGEITPRRGCSEDSSALIIFSAPAIRFAASVAEAISEDHLNSLTSGYEKARSRLAAEPALALVFPDGLSTMSVPIDGLLRSVMGETLPIFGGSAGDGFQIKQTFQFLGDRVYTDAMPIMLMAGEIDMSIAIATGPVPSGDFYRVDGVTENVIHHIDGVTALEFYERFFGPYIEDRELSFFPLAVYTGDSEDFVLRDPVGIDRNDGSISFVGRIEEPCRVRITQITREDTIESGHRGAEKVLSSFPGDRDGLILIFSCASRKHVLGSRVNEEIEVLKQDPRQIPYFGFYCYGEIGPFTIGGPVHFHSDTCITVALYNRRT